MSELQNIECGWKGCSLKFGSEGDMNMHVVMNHTSILDFAEIVIKKNPVKRKTLVETGVDAISGEIMPKKRKVTRGSTPARTPREPTIAPALMHFATPQPETTPKIIQMFQQSAMCSADGQSDGTATEVKVEIPETSSSEQVEEGEVDMLAQFDPSHFLMAQAPRKLSEVISEMIGRMKPMKQLGFIRPHRTVYCVVCLKFMRSLHECNWKHTPAEDQIAEMWTRRFGHEKPTGKHQLIQEFEELREWILEEENAGRMHNFTE